MIKWYQKPVWIIILLIVFFPVGLILLWRYGKHNNTFKIAVTILAVFIGIPFWVNALSSNNLHSDLSELDIYETIASASIQMVETTALETTALETTALETTALETVALQTVTENIDNMTSASESKVLTKSAVLPVSGGVLRVHYLDVGQADSEFIEFPDGRTMLIDAGNAGDGSLVTSYIANLGYSKIDYLIATHPHEDHIGGMEAVINYFEIGAIYMPEVLATTETFDDMLTAIQSKGYKINSAKAGMQIAPGINILSPSASSDYGDELNDWSAIISIVYGSKTFLFLGDAGVNPESALTLSADVVKVSHHGSRTAYTAALFEKLSPEIVIISVGADNDYGLPDEDVLQGLVNTGTAIYRTDENGTVIIESNGKSVTVHTTVSEVVPVNNTDAGTALQTTAAETAAATTGQSDDAVIPVTTTTSDSQAAPTSPDSNSAIVYKTKSGECYHSDGCSSLSKSKIEITLENAKAEGLRPCSKCSPPQ